MTKTFNLYRWNIFFPSSSSSCQPKDVHLLPAVDRLPPRLPTTTGRHSKTLWLLLSSCLQTMWAVIANNSTGKVTLVSLRISLFLLRSRRGTPRTDLSIARCVTLNHLLFFSFSLITRILLDLPPNQY